MSNLREEYPNLTPAQYRARMREAEIDHFDLTHRYCGVCGTETERKELGIDSHETEIYRVCPNCGREFYPVLTPAIVVLVLRDDEALLVHARNFRGNMHALVAGFVEPAESLEECVAREVAEETGLRIKDITYRGSQSWPFPSQLMVGFTARYAGGEIKFADHELTSGGWFSRSNPPAELPTPPSLSHYLIYAWLEGKIS